MRTNCPVSGKILKKAGSKYSNEVLKYVDEHGSPEVGAVSLFEPGDLKNCKAIINVVGPVWLGGTENEREDLKKALEAAFSLASEKGLHSIAVPAVSYGGSRAFPSEECAKISLETALQFWTEHPETSLNDIILINDDFVNSNHFIKELSARKGTHFVRTAVISSGTKSATLSTSDTRRKVEITGLPELVSKAKEKILSRISSGMVNKLFPLEKLSAAQVAQASRICEKYLGELFQKNIFIFFS